MSDEIEEPVSQREQEEVEDEPLLKPKQKRQYTDEQREAARERMKKVNADRIAKAQYNQQKLKEIKKLKMIQQKRELDDKLQKLKEEVKEEPEPPSKKTKSRKSIKVVTIESSDTSDSDDSDDESIPDAKIVVLNNKSKSKSLTKEKIEKSQKVEPTPVPPKSIHKFL